MMKSLKKALIVEENHVGREIQKTMLENLGCFVDLVLTAEEGLQKIEENGYDIVFTEIRFHGMNGVEFTKNIRKKDKKLIIVAVSFFNDEKNLKIFKEAGINKVLVKPFSEENLAECLALIL